jgi:hypothetical protein
MATSLPIDTSRRHETHDANALGITYAVLGLVAILIAILFWMHALFFRFAKEDRPQSARPFANVRPLPQEPRLQVSPEEDWKDYKQGQDSELNHYGWVNKERGVVRIPIDRAMDLLLQRGLPTRPPSNGGTR